MAGPTGRHSQGVLGPPRPPGQRSRRFSNHRIDKLGACYNIALIDTGQFSFMASSVPVEGGRPRTNHHRRCARMIASCPAVMTADEPRGLIVGRGKINGRLSIAMPASNATWSQSRPMVRSCRSRSRQLVGGHLPVHRRSGRRASPDTTLVRVHDSRRGRGRHARVVKFRSGSRPRERAVRQDLRCQSDRQPFLVLPVAEAGSAYGPPMRSMTRSCPPSRARSAA